MKTNPKIKVVSTQVVATIIASGVCFAHATNSINVKKQIEEASVVFFDYKTTTYAFVK